MAASKPKKPWLRSNLIKGICLMIAQAKAKYLRVSPQKARLVVDLIRGKDVVTSQTLLTHVNKGSKEKILKVLNSAVSNAKQKGLTEDQLIVSRITATSGPMWKRFRAASFGRATPILRRTTHITIELDLKTKS
jgi:large subunit ribosomal protein L22